jgi:hypothetical protein
VGLEIVEEKIGYLEDLVYKVLFKQLYNKNKYLYKKEIKWQKL